jgi:superfamily I DNA and RNA helicase
VTAHAMGFGIYRNIVQMLESREHWEDVGYDVLTGELQVGEEVRVVRPPQNSPLEIDGVPGFPLIASNALEHYVEEVAWIVSEIVRFVKAGLQPEDIMVVALDDRNAKAYASSISENLAEVGIRSNNILANPYTEPPFTVSGCVTLSTVYRAKGNEAALVLAVGIDGIAAKARSGRNKLFTAFTRSKAWLRVSGVGAVAKALLTELEDAKLHFPYLEFIMPDLTHINLIQRDLSEKESKAKKLREDFFKRAKAQGFTDEEAQDLFSDTSVIKNA